MQLSSLDRAALVEDLIASLDKPDRLLMHYGSRKLKAEDRIAAYQAGELTAIDVEEAFASDRLGDVALEQAQASKIIGVPGR